MNYRLLVNPGSPQAWVIRLKPGTNRLGRDPENDFVLSHDSVSNAHCVITVNEAGSFLKDLGSTNGTFVNRKPVTEIQLQPGQHVQVGQVDMTFDVDPASSTLTSPAAATAVTASSAPAAKQAFCKAHPKMPASYHCNRCQKHLCDQCVNTRGAGTYCRTCGIACTPLAGQPAAPEEAKGARSRWPFRR